ncbi:hypothetical protein ACFQZC_24635 [Streptacidiphilus monticola]
MSRYLQEGRSYSMVSLGVTAAAWFLIRRQWVRYAVALALAVALNLLAGLSLAAFAAALLLWRRQGAADGRALLRAAVASGAALLVGAAPVLWRAHSESAVLYWIPGRTSPPSASWPPTWPAAGPWRSRCCCSWRTAPGPRCAVGSANWRPWRCPWRCCRRCCCSPCPGWTSRCTSSATSSTASSASPGWWGWGWTPPSAGCRPRRRSRWDWSSSC